MADRNTMLKQISETSFLLDDMRLYLDTHQNDAEAFALFKQYAAMEKAAVAAYESKYGPLMKSSAAAGDRYRWLQDPWPWNYQQNEVT